MFRIFAPKTEKKEILVIDTGEGRGSYGELLNPPIQESLCISGEYNRNHFVSGNLYPFSITGKLDLTPVENNDRFEEDLTEDSNAGYSESL